MAGVILFNVRQNTGWLDDFELERALILASWLVAAAGAAPMAGLRDHAGRPALLVSGAVLFAVGALMAAVAELSLLTREFTVASAWEAIFVPLLFAGGALMGAGLLMSRLVPRWIAWTVTTWNVLSWVTLLAISGDAVYYPGLHYIPLLLIGISIRASSREPASTSSA